MSLLHSFPSCPPARPGFWGACPLALLLLLFLVWVSGQALAVEPESVADRRAYDLPAGPLAGTLNRIAREGRLALTLDAASIGNRVSSPVRGQYTAVDALKRALEGSGMELVQTELGNYTLREIPKPVAGDMEMPEITVRAAATGIYSQPRAEGRINREHMDRTGPRHASEILQSTPGVATVTNEQIPSVSVNVRGLKDFGRVNMNIDGMRQNYQRTGHQQRNGEMFFDPELLSSVDIVKGPSSGVGGAGSSGGAASFRTLMASDVLRDSDERFGARLRLSSGIPEWDNGQEPSGSVAIAVLPTENTDLLLAWSRKKTDEYEPGHRGQAYVYPQDYAVPANIVNGTGMDTESLLAKAGWNITPAQRLQFTWLGFRAAFSESSMISDDAYLAYYCSQAGQSDPATCAGFVYDHDSVYPISSSSNLDNANLAVDYTWNPDSPWLDMAAKTYVVRTRNDNVSASQGIYSKTQTDTLGYQLSNHAYLALPFEGRLDVTAGYEYFRDETRPGQDSTTLTGGSVVLADGSTPEGSREIGSFFADTQWFFWDERLRLQAGIRRDAYRLWGTVAYRNQSVDVIRHVDREQSKVLGTWGASLRLWEHVQVFYNAGNAWRPPAITETLISGSPAGHPTAVPSSPNWTLLPEETFSQELGINFTTRQVFSDHDSLMVKFTRFQNETENYIFLMNYVGFPGDAYPSLSQSMFANAVDPIRFFGEELQASYDAGRWFAELTATHLQREGHTYSWWWPAGGAACAPGCNTVRRSDYTGGLYDPVPPEYTAALNLGLRLLQGRVELGTTGRYTGRSGSATGGAPVDASQGGYVNSSQVFDLWGSWRPSARLRFGFNLRNLTDRQYLQAQGDAYVRSYAPGRTLTASVEAFF